MSAVLKDAPRLVREGLSGARAGTLNPFAVLDLPPTLP